MHSRYVSRASPTRIPQSPLGCHTCRLVDNSGPMLTLLSLFQLLASSAALDLAPLFQTPPHTSFMNRKYQAEQKLSEWPPFSTNACPSVCQSSLATTLEFGAKLAGSAASMPLNQMHSPIGSRRGSPQGFMVSEGIIGSNTFNLHLVPISPITLGVSTPGLVKQDTLQVSTALPTSTASKGMLGPIGQQLSAAGDLGRISASLYDSPAQYNIQHGVDDQAHQVCHTRFCASSSHVTFLFSNVVSCCLLRV